MGWIFLWFEYCASFPTNKKRKSFRSMFIQLDSFCFVSFWFVFGRISKCFVIFYSELRPVIANNDRLNTIFHIKKIFVEHPQCLFWVILITTRREKKIHCCRLNIQAPLHWHTPRRSITLIQSEKVKLFKPKYRIMARKYSILHFLIYSSHLYYNADTIITMTTIVIVMHLFLIVNRPFQ